MDIRLRLDTNKGIIIDLITDIYSSGYYCMTYDAWIESTSTFFNIIWEDFIFTIKNPDFAEIMVEEKIVVKDSDLGFRKGPLFDEFISFMKFVFKNQAYKIINGKAVYVTPEYEVDDVKISKY